MLCNHNGAGRGLRNDRRIKNRIRKFKLSFLLNTKHNLNTYI